MTDDLTDNDLVIRQINYAHIISRLLLKRLIDDSTSCEDFKTSEDFYGDQKYWRRANLCMRIILFSFLVLCLTQRFFIKALIFLSSPLPLQKLNILIQLKRKAQQYD